MDRGAVAGGTTSAGEGNILVSDKAPGPELTLALRSAARWRSLADELGEDALEYEPKGGVVVARQEATLGALGELAAAQRAAGVSVEAIDGTSAAMAGGLQGRVGRAVQYDMILR